MLARPPLLWMLARPPLLWMLARPPLLLMLARPPLLAEALPEPTSPSPLTGGVSAAAGSGADGAVRWLMCRRSWNMFQQDTFHPAFRFTLLHRYTPHVEHFVEGLPPRFTREFTCVVRLPVETAVS